MRVGPGAAVLQTRFCPRRKRLAHRRRFTCDHTQVGACCSIGLVASLLPITDRSNRNMERGRELLLGELEGAADDTNLGHPGRTSPFLIRHWPSIRISHGGGVPLGFGHRIGATPVELAFAFTCSLHDSAVVPVVPPSGPR